MTIIYKGNTQTTQRPTGKKLPCLRGSEKRRGGEDSDRGSRNREEERKIRSEIATRKVNREVIDWSKRSGCSKPFNMRRI